MNFCPANSRSRAIGRLLQRLDATAVAVRPAFPLAADTETGHWQTAADGRWTGGFWVGLLWLAHHQTGRAAYAALACEWMARLRPRIGIKNALNGLVFYYGAALGSVLGHDATAHALALEAAEALDRCFDPIARVFPLGGDTTEIVSADQIEANVDALAGMTLLFWAAEAGGARNLQSHALSHAHRLCEACQRADGSLHQSVGFDPGSGAITRRFTPRGFSQDSTWARAQSWGLLGLTQAARRDASLLAAARRVADSWIARTAADPVAFWDFDDPAIPATERDTSATTMAAAALLKLASLLNDPAEARSYRNHAETTVERLICGYLTPTRSDDQRPIGMLTEGCWQRTQNMATHHELIWGDYFLLESLLQLEGRLPFI